MIKKGVVLAFVLAVSVSVSAAEKQERIGIVVSTKFGFGHACPVSEDYALTAGHVIDPEPMNREVPLYPVRYFGDGDKILDAEPVDVFRETDVGLLRGKFVRPYRISEVPVSLGDTVRIEGFDWRDVDRLFRTRIFEARVVSIMGGKFSFDKNPDFGSSGSCVLDAQGDVVGIEVWGVGGFGSRRGTGVAEATWGLTLDTIEKLDKKAGGEVIVLAPEKDPE